MIQEGIKGVVKPEVGALSSGNGRRNQETTPYAPFFKGEFFHRFPSLPVSSGTYG
jgi:hypothetical protein